MLFNFGIQKRYNFQKIDKFTEVCFNNDLGTQSNLFKYVAMHSLL